MPRYIVSWVSHAGGMMEVEAANIAEAYDNAVMEYGEAMEALIAAARNGSGHGPSITITPIYREEASGEGFKMLPPLKSK